VLYVIRSVHKFDFRLVIKAKPNKSRPVERSWGERDACFSYDLYPPHPHPPTIVVASVVRLFAPCVGQLHPLE